MEPQEDIEESIWSFIIGLDKDPSRLVIEYISGLPEDQVEPRTASLLDFLKESMEDTPVLPSRNPGTLVLGLHHAYPLFLTILDYWFYSIYNPIKHREFSFFKRRAIYNRLKVGIGRWNPVADIGKYEYLLGQAKPRLW